MRSVNQNLRHVEKVENDLVRKENKIEKDIRDKEVRDRKEKEEERKKKEEEERKKRDEHIDINQHKGEDNWGENDGSHEIHMQPLTIHKMGGPPTSLFDVISHLHDKIKDLHSNISSKISGESV